MDRRSLLKLIGLAPVAAPVLAQSALASGGVAGFTPIYGEAILGETLAFGQMTTHNVAKLGIEMTEPSKELVRAWADDLEAAVHAEISEREMTDEGEFARWMPDGFQSPSA